MMQLIRKFLTAYKKQLKKHRKYITILSLKMKVLGFSISVFTLDHIKRIAQVCKNGQRHHQTNKGC